LCGIPVDLLTHGLYATHLPVMAEATIYRIVQAALTNILKHAQATQVRVILERRAELLRVIVEDNGQGFDVAAVRSERCGGRHVGLVEMDDRAGRRDDDLSAHPAA
jgi:signal transduction histidine kinase